MILELIELARRQGMPCTATATSDLRRMGPSRPTVRVLGLTGRDPNLGLEAMLAAPGTIVWLANVRYPPNLGAAMRTTEVSGASGMIISGTSSMRERKTAVRSAVRADRFIPVHWLLHEEAVTAIRASRTQGRGDRGRGERSPPGRLTWWMLSSWSVPSSRGFPRMCWRWHMRSYGYRWRASFHPTTCTPRSPWWWSRRCANGGALTDRGTGCAVEGDSWSDS